MSEHAASCCSVGLETMETTSVLPLYMQLLTLGSLMIIGHCSGMCGPLMLSFGFGREQERPALAASRQLLVYQIGKAVVYMSAGALAALLGYSLSAVRDWAAWLTLMIAVLILLQALIWWSPVRLPGLRLLPRRWSDGLQQLVRGLQRRSAQQRQRTPLRGSFLLGMTMALLPCMLPFWVLSLAASSAAPLHGALLMGLLVLLNTPVLLLFAVAPHLLPRWRERRSRNLAPLALCCSGVWMLLISLASLNMIGHFGFELGPTHVVFW